MEVHRGLLRQRGHGILGSLLKIGAPLVAGMVGEVAGGLIKKKIQKGRGISWGNLIPSIGDSVTGLVRKGLHKGITAVHDRAMRAAGNNAPLQTGIASLGNIAMDVLHKKRTLPQALRHYGTHAVKLTGNNFIEQKLSPILKTPVVGPLLNKTVMPLVRRKVNSAIDSLVQKAVGQRGKGAVGDVLKRGIKGVGPMMKSGIKAIFRRGVKKQVQRGARKLAQTAAEQAISGATKAGIDVLRGKNVKQAVQQRTAQALSNTSQVAKRTVNRTSQATKQAVNRTTQAAKKAAKRKFNEMAAAAPILANAALDLRPVPVKRKKKKRAGDIFD